MTTELAGILTIEALPYLESLSIGASKASITRVGGDVELSWP